MPVYQLVSGMEGERGIILHCICHSEEHNLHMMYWADDPEERELYISPHLCPFVWWKRVWLAIRYIFGYRSRYGDYASITLSQHDVVVLQKFLAGFPQKEEGQ